jgi:membrane fusion protein, peptide pheromone/bacteriocin exporter
MLYPKEIIELEIEHPAAKFSHTTRIIYLTSIIVVILAAVLLPFIKVTISVTSHGILRPVIEICAIKAPTNGKIIAVWVAENDRVTRGQVLLALDSSLLFQKKSFIRERISECKAFEADLAAIVKERVTSTQIRTPFYRQSYLDYQRKLNECEIYYQKVKTNYTRQQRLYKEKVIAEAEFETYQFEYDDAANRLELLRQSQFAIWQGDMLKHRDAIAKHEEDLRLLQLESKNLIVKAEVNGTVESLESLHHGSPVFANQEVGKISPDTSLIAEIFVEPSDIGLLTRGMNVRLQVAAFNYNQWGLAEGKVKEISDDIQIVNEQAMFRVKCSLTRNFLQLKNGYKGVLMKGMTLQARFLVAERSLWQLLYDKADDWLNPSSISN